MSNAIFPSALPGITLVTSVAPRFSTKIQSAISGRETRAAFMSYPLWDITFNYELLRSDSNAELDQVMGFFLQVKGSFDSFLVSIPNDNALTDMTFGTGNASQVAFQLTRTRGAGGFGFVEPVQNINVITNVKINGVATTAYTISSVGVITFTTAPATSAVITWTGSYYYRCRFTQDTASFDRFMNNLWELKKVQMVGAPGNRV